jgi:peroxiredoxin Q/BCP
LIAVGERAPDFDLALADGTRLRLGDVLARGPLVLFFYPKDDSPGCTAEVCSFRDAYATFAERGAQVVGVSSDAVASHAAFATRHRLPFPLASDPGGAARRAYGVPKVLGVLPGRVTFVIDRDGIVRSAFNSMFAPQKHVAAALDMIQTLA